jgi:Autophagocytosis associated protein, active-site domain
MWTTTVDFEVGAKRLVEVFQCILEEYDRNEKSSHLERKHGLLDWKLVVGQEEHQHPHQHAAAGDMFLRHAPILSSHHAVSSSISPPPVNHHDSSNIDEHLTDDDDSDGLLFIDDSIIGDPQVVSSSSLPRNSIDDENETAASTVLMLEWSFSVVYSDTWQVPILYFHVQQCSRDDHGSYTPCSRSMVVDILSHLHHQNLKLEEESDHHSNNTDINDNASTYSSWDFVSSDEHPVTGLPCFFLHPCRTRERLEILLRTTNTPVTSSTEKAAKSEKDQQQQQQQQQQLESSSESSDPAMLLLIWMSLILPSVGHGFSARTFAKLMGKLKS